MSKTYEQPQDPLAFWISTPPLGTIARAELLSTVHDDVEGRLIHLSRKAMAGTLTQHEALERARLLKYDEWLEVETIDAFAALPESTAEKVRSGESIV